MILRSEEIEQRVVDGQEVLLPSKNQWEKIFSGELVDDRQVGSPSTVELLKAWSKICNDIDAL
jgi:hypothetical protein